MWFSKAHKARELKASCKRENLQALDTITALKPGDDDRGLVSEKQEVKNLYKEIELEKENSCHFNSLSRGLGFPTLAAPWD
jgi:hypothetical protein